MKIDQASEASEESVRGAGRPRIRRRSPGWVVVVQVLATVAGSWLVADTVNAMVSGGLGPTRVNRREAKGASRPSSSLRDSGLEEIVRRNVFLHGEPGPLEDEVPAAACPLPIRVLSMVHVVERPELGLAAIRDDSSGKPEILVVQAGDAVAGAEVLRVFAAQDGETGVVQLRMEGGGLAACLSGREPRGSSTVGSPAAERRVAEVRPGVYVVPKQVAAILTNGEIGTEARTLRIVPYFEGGNPTGFKLYAIAPGSLVAQAGFKNGDVLRRINGMDLHDPASSMRAYEQLKGELAFDVELTRGGEPQTFRYTVE